MSEWGRGCGCLGGRRMMDVGGGAGGAVRVGALMMMVWRRAVAGMMIG